MPRPRAAIRFSSVDDAICIKIINNTFNAQYQMVLSLLLNTIIIFINVTMTPKTYLHALYVCVFVVVVAGLLLSLFLSSSNGASGISV